MTETEMKETTAICFEYLRDHLDSLRDAKAEKRLRTILYRHAAGYASPEEILMEADALYLREAFDASSRSQTEYSYPFRIGKICSALNIGSKANSATNTEFMQMNNLSFFLTSTGRDLTMEIHESEEHARWIQVTWKWGSLQRSIQWGFLSEEEAQIIRKDLSNWRIFLKWIGWK